MSAINTTGKQPYKFDFLEQLVGISFPQNKSDGFVVLSIDAFADINGIVPGPCPPVVFNLGAGERVLDTTEQCTTQVIPSRVVDTTFTILWPGVLPLPTAADYGNLVFEDFLGPVLYAQQFSRIVHPDGFGGVFPFALPQPYTNGFYPDLSSAAAAAAAWNVAFPPGAYFYLRSDGATVPIGLAGVAVRQFTVPVTIPAHSISTLRKLTMIKVPKALTQFTVTVNANGGNSRLGLYGFHTKPPLLVTSVNPAAADTFALVLPPVDGNATYTGTSVIVNSFNTVTLVGPGGPGG